MSKKETKSKRKHRINVLTIITILASIGFLAIILFLVYLIITDYKSSQQKNIKDIIGSIASTFTCLVASSSLIVTLSTRNKAVKEKEDELQRDTEYFWFKTLILDKHLDAIFAFFTFCHIMLAEHKRLNNELSASSHDDYLKNIKEKIMRPFTEKYVELQQSMIISSGIINKDLSSAIQGFFQVFQDKYTNYIYSNNPNYEQAKKYIEESQKTLIVLIKDYNFTIIK